MLDLHNPKQAPDIIKALESGKAGQFWHIIQQSIDENIKFQQSERDSDDLADLPVAEYKVEDQILRNKIKYLLELKRIPDTIIAELSPSEPLRQEELDPYEHPAIDTDTESDEN